MNPPRLILFLTQEVAADVPCGETKLACLLPLGSGTFVERLMDSCALAGIRQVDLVVSAHPELLRTHLMDGTPWGIQLRWHHAKESHSPYKALRGLGLDPDQHTVFGHGGHWVSSKVLSDLMQSPGVALQIDTEFKWAGWFSAKGGAEMVFGQHLDFAALAKRLGSMNGHRVVLAGEAECASAATASDLLQAQQFALRGEQESSIPATWLRMPWGAMSPDAQVSDQATLVGPVLIGAGCVVEEGVELGPEVVLARDVYIAKGARAGHSLILPNTYVGGQISLEHAVAQGNSIQSLKWNVRTDLQTEDALMTHLRSRSHPGTPWLERALALVVWMLLLPLQLPVLLVQWFFTGHLAWKVQSMVCARVADSDQLAMVNLRTTHSRRTPDLVVAFWGGLLDIVQGRRTWFGVRPRTEAQWHALARDWQNLFSAHAIGLFHAQAWSESSQSLNDEAVAAADAFMVVQKGALLRIKMLFNGAVTSA